MQVNFKMAAVAVAAVLASAAQAQVAFDANVETNSQYTGSQGATASNFSNGGRVEINATATKKNGDYFVTGRGTLIVNLNNTSATTDAATIDDAWVQFGSSKVDFKMGRFEASDLFPVGNDVMLVDATAGAITGYRADGASLRGRLKDGRFHGAVGINASSSLRLELGMVAQNHNVFTPYGFRPTAVYTSGPLTLRAGFESLKGVGATATTSGASQTGYVVSAGYAPTSSSMINAMYAKNSDANASSAGLTAAFGPAFIAYMRDTTAGVSRNNVYANYTLSLFDIKGASIIPSVSTSNATGFSSVSSVGVRVHYDF